MQYATHRFENMGSGPVQNRSIIEIISRWISDIYKRTFDNVPPELGILAC